MAFIIYIFFYSAESDNYNVHPTSQNVLLQLQVSLKEKRMDGVLAPYSGMTWCDLSKSEDKITRAITTKICDVLDEPEIVRVECAFCVMAKSYHPRRA